MVQVWIVLQQSEHFNDTILDHDKIKEILYDVFASYIDKSRSPTGQT